MVNEHQKAKRLFNSVIFSLEFCCLAYSGLVSRNIGIQLGISVSFLAAYILAFVVQRYAEINGQKRFLLFFLMIPLCFPLVFASAFVYCRLDQLIWDRNDHSVERQSLDDGRDHMFAGKKVMIFVPHEDDDVLLMGGVLEQYVKYNSEVYVVFEQTGDSGVSESSYSVGKELGQARAKEAIKVLTSYGIPEKNIIFLGYGSTVSRYHAHLYNMKDEPDRVVSSVSGFDHTYATEEHPSFREGEKITRNNLFNDYENLILSYKPDILFCVDYDSHPGHRAVSLMFENVMGEILKRQDSYRPIVYKGFGYSTSLYAPWDYYSSVNTASAVNPYDTDYMQETNTYLWKDRVRFPVAVNTLTHYVASSDTIKKLSLYETQYGDWHKNIKGIVNSDKVFWERRTDSLLYNAKITASSGDTGLLNDFMLFDCDNIIAGETDLSNIPGIWIPSDSDAEKTVSVVMNDLCDIEKIYLYDNPCMDDNVENARIIFDDGSVIETGKLMPNGSATVIPVNKRNVKSFKIVLTNTTGKRAGLSEIEAYGPEIKRDMGFVKLMDDREDFVYDYYLNGREEVRFSLYRYNYDIPLNSDYKIETSNPRVTAAISDNQLLVRCPKGQVSTIRITGGDGMVSDTVRVSNKSLSGAFMMGVRLSENYQMILLYFCLKIAVIALIVMLFSFFVSDKKERLSVFIAE